LIDIVSNNGLINSAMFFLLFLNQIRFIEIKAQSEIKAKSKIL